MRARRCTPLGHNVCRSDRSHRVPLPHPGSRGPGNDGRDRRTAGLKLDCYTVSDIPIECARTPNPERLLDSTMLELTDQPTSVAEPDQQRRRQVALSIAAVGILGAAGLGAYVTGEGPRAAPSAEASMVSTTITPSEPNPAAVEPRDLAIADPAQNAQEASTAIEQERADGGCTIGALSLRLGASGDGVRCLQEALSVAGVFGGTVSGEFDQATATAVVAFQTAENLFVDGVVGRESAIALGHLARRGIAGRADAAPSRWSD